MELFFNEERMTLARWPNEGWATIGTTKASGFRQLDRPGEWYLDRRSGVLYFWPPSPIEQGRIVMSILQDPVVLLQDVSHVTLQGFTVEACRGAGIRVNGGRKNRIAACVVRNTGQEGIVVSGGEGHLVEACDIYDIGATPWDDGRWRDFIKGGLMHQRLQVEVDITKPPFITKYPELEGLLEPDGRPRQNRAVRNVAVKCGAFLRGNYDDVDNWLTQNDPGFVDVANGDLGLAAGSPAFGLGFEPIPIERIGPEGFGR